MERNDNALDVNLRLQKKFLVSLFSGLFFCLSLLGIGLYFWGKQEFLAIFQNSRLVIKSMQEMILPIVLLCSAIAIMFTLLLSWGIVHLFFKNMNVSLRKIRTYLNEFIKNGDFSSQFIVKSDDQLSDLGMTVDDLRKSLQEKTLSLKKKCLGMRVIERELVRLWRLGVKIENKELEDVIKQFKKQQRLIENECSSFFC